MAQSSVLEWLNENEFRSYPLRFTRNKEVIIRGLGLVALGAFDSAKNAWLVNGSADNQGVYTAFLSQITPGDLLEIEGQRAEVALVNNGAFSNSTLYLNSQISLSSTAYAYAIVKKNKSLDPDQQVDFNFDGVFLDANLVYNSTPEVPAQLGQLLSITISGSDLRAEVYGQELFIVPSYASASYPYYARNANGSLLVFGSAARWVKRPTTFLNQTFEASTISVMDKGWRGVSSLSFNQAGSLTGDVVFEEGYQAGLLADAAKNIIKVSAGRREGNPAGCERIYGESVTADCGEVISFINGALPRSSFGDLALSAGEHISIYPDPDRHRIYVGLNFNRDDICQSAPDRPVTQL